MKNDWPTKKLGEICDIYQPQTITSNEILKEGPYKVFGANGVIGYYSKYNHEDAEVLVTCRGATCGTINMSEPKSWITGNAMVVHPKDEKILLKSFLYYELKHSNLLKTITGTGQPQITRNSLAPFQILLPPLKIQKQIVGRLDKIAEAQKLNNELIQKAEELYRSLLHNELNAKLKNQKSKLQFKIQKLEEVAEVTSTKRVFQSEYVTQGVPFYRTKEIVELSRGKPISLELFISEKHFDEIRNKFGAPQKGDILISAVGTIGISWMVSDNRKFYFKDGNLLWIKNFDGIDPSYLKIVLDNFLKAISKLSAGAAYNALTIIKLKKVKIPLPPLKIQKQIVEKLSAAQEYKTQLHAQKSKLKELFDSILDKSMKGEMT